MTAPRHARSLAGQSGGFTILELLIATSVFAVVLLIVAAAIVGFTSSYLKGVNSSNTQQVARSIIGDVSQAIEFGTNFTPQSGSGADGYCINNTEYIYKTGQFVGTGTHGLVKDQSGCVSTPVMPATLNSNQRELLSANMRLGDLSISPGPNNTYVISVTVIQGGDGTTADQDLLVNISAADGSLPAVGGDWSGVRCRSTVGSQFCAVSTLTTTVQQRIATSGL